METAPIFFKIRATKEGPNSREDFQSDKIIWKKEKDHSLKPPKRAGRRILETTIQKKKKKSRKKKKKEIGNPSGSGAQSPLIPLTAIRISSIENLTCKEAALSKGKVKKEIPPSFGRNQPELV